MARRPLICLLGAHGITDDQCYTTYPQLLGHQPVLCGDIIADRDRRKVRAIERRRSLPVRFTQWLQLTIQKRVISRVLESQQRPKPPLLLKALTIVPFLRRIPAWLIGVGVRPEHIHTPG